MFWNSRAALAENFPGTKTDWHQERDLPDQTGRVHLITGGNNGIGRETARWLLRANAKVYIAARSPEKTYKAIAELKEDTGREAHFLLLDLASLASIRRAASEFLAHESELHALYNNAGVMMVDMNLLTEDGYDLQVGTNALGHFYFTQLLLPALRRAQGGSRVVNVSSCYHYMTSGLKLDTFKPGPQRDGAFMGKAEMYAQSKLGNLLFSQEFHRRYHQDGIVSTALNPGNIKTDLWQHSRLFDWLIPVKFDTTFGCLNMLYAGTAPEAKEHGGKYIAPWAKVTKPHKAADNPALSRDFWDWCEKEIKQFEAAL